MNSKGHLIISLSKSVIRMVGGCVALVVGNVLPLALSIIIAEIGGILEEVVDKR